MCDGNSVSVISNRACDISLNILKASPYNLVKGDSIYAKIISSNIYGDSEVYSEAGNGAVIQLVPDAPVNLVNDATTTIDTLIRFTWS